MSSKPDVWRPADLSRGCHVVAMLDGNDDMTPYGEAFDSSTYVEVVAVVRDGVIRNDTSGAGPMLAPPQGGPQTQATVRHAPH